MINDYLFLTVSSYWVRSYPADRNTKSEYRSAYVKTTADKNPKQIQMNEILNFQNKGFGMTVPK